MKSNTVPNNRRKRGAKSLSTISPSMIINVFVVAIFALVALATRSQSFHGISCEAYVPPSSSTPMISLSKEKAAAISRQNTALYDTSRRFGRNNEAERLKRKRDELEAKALQQELLTEVREAEQARKRIERDIREAEERRRALDEQSSTGRDYIDNLRSGRAGAVNDAKVFLDTGISGKKRGRPSKLDIERERLELELEQLKSKQKAEENTKLLTTYGGLATVLGVAANVLNANGDLGDVGTASGLRQLFPSTSKYLTDLSAENDNQRITAAAAKKASGNIEMPYLDAKIAELEKKVKEERNTVKEEARELDRLAREKEEARKKGLIEAEQKAEREAKEKAEKEAKEKAEREAKEKAKKEAKEKAEREAKEKAEKEANEKAEIEATAEAGEEANENTEGNAAASATTISSPTKSTTEPATTSTVDESKAVAESGNNDGFLKQVQEDGFVNAFLKLDVTTQATAAAGVLASGAAAALSIVKRDDDNGDDNGSGFGGNSSFGNQGRQNNQGGPSSWDASVWECTC
ncbi:unnamed protein product [Pseudo-nitzschia multistriata]|uniref:Uncharacterized protein n=1 Tax=Pseudo-nitzschia multistriata TaxID=183589 RepID=A0A448ZFN5_9STRA|nr:unnamed protein product [Pseudo-nitzschia multistriata]